MVFRCNFLWNMKRRMKVTLDCNHFLQKLNFDV